MKSFYVINETFNLVQFFLHIYCSLMLRSLLFTSTAIMLRPPSHQTPATLCH